jgi:hypothetical protein
VLIAIKVALRLRSQLSLNASDVKTVRSQRLKNPFYTDFTTFRLKFGNKNSQKNASSRICTVAKIPYNETTKKIKT